MVLNARDAAERGAEIATRTRCCAASRHGNLWTMSLEDAAGGRREIRARALVNAAGPWVGDVLGHVIRSNSRGAGPPGEGQPHRGAAAVCA